VVTRDFVPLFDKNGFGFNFPLLGPQGDISMEDAQFLSSADGTWRFREEVVGTPLCRFDDGVFCVYFASGIGSVWTRVPAPSTLVLLGVGLAGMIAALYARRSTSERRY
jgi:hypothetical protein